MVWITNFLGFLLFFKLFTGCLVTQTPFDSRLQQEMFSFLAALDNFPCSWDFSGSFNLKKVEGKRGKKPTMISSWGLVEQQKEVGKASVKGNAGLVLPVVHSSTIYWEISSVSCSGCSFLIVLKNRRLWHGKITVADFEAEPGLMVEDYW